MSEKIVGFVMSGGVGSRLWPLSREEFPKQLQPLTSERSLLQETALRLGTAVDGVTVGCFPDLYGALAGNPPDHVITL